MRLPQITALYIGAVLGSGILIIPGAAAEVSGPASLLAWGLMALLVLPMSLTIGLLSAKYPDAGGVSYFVSKAFNARLGALTGWYFVFAVVVGAPVLALTGAGYLCTSLGLGDTCRLALAIVILIIGITANYFGMKITGRLQVVVVLTIIAVLVGTIIGSFSRIVPANFSPFMPHGPFSIGYTLTILFWCFIGWEAVSNMTGEFENPRRDTITGTIIAVMITSIIYFLTALAVVGTHSYGQKITDASLVHIIKSTFGSSGAVIAGIAGLFICMAPAIAYIGAIARLVHSLAGNGYAPRSLALLSKRHRTPLGGLLFLACCFAVLLIIFSTRVMPLATLIQVPGAAFVLTYVGASAAGIKLLKDSKPGMLMSYISLVFAAVIFLFSKWTIAYVILITLMWYLFMLKTKGLCRRPPVTAGNQ